VQISQKAGKLGTSVQKHPRTEVKVEGQETEDNDVSSNLVGGTPKITVKIQDLDVEAVVDCGSQVTILSESFSRNKSVNTR